MRKWVGACVHHGPQVRLNFITELLSNVGHSWRKGQAGLDLLETRILRNPVFYWKAEELRIVKDL